MKKKAANGDGSIEWRKVVAWARIALPRTAGEPLQRKRLPIVGSDKMTLGQVRKAATKLAADVRGGRVIIEDRRPRKGAAPHVSTILTAGPPKTHHPASFPGCEGGDLNPDALSGASTSS